jgi:hypothetical protein
VRLNSANRAVALSVALAVLPFVLLVIVFCGVTSAVAVQLMEHPSRLVRLSPGLVVVAVLFAGLLLGARSLRRQWHATTAVDRDVRRLQVPTDARLARVVDGLRLPVLLVGDDAPYSFAYGLRRPKVVVSTGLVTCCSDGELTAVLEHERYHVLARDPLKVALTRTLSAAGFYLPALRSLHRRYIIGRELAADRRAVGRHGVAPLAGALYRSVNGVPNLELSAAAALGGADALDLRLAQLETGAEPALPPLNGRHLVVTGAVLVVLSAMLAVTWLALDGLHAFDGGGMNGSMGSSASVLGTIACGAPWVLLAGWLVCRRYRRRGLTRPE